MGRGPEFIAPDYNCRRPGGEPILLSPVPTPAVGCYNPRMDAVDLAGLKATITPELDNTEVRATVVLLHGFGAPGNDLVGLASALSQLKRVRFVFPEGLHSLTGAGMPPGGRAWWNIDMVELQIALMTGRFDALARSVPEGLAEAREALTQALMELERSYGMTPERLVVGGFSQGAMLACDWTLNTDFPLLGLVQLSTMLICEERWLSLLPTRAGLPVFQSHSPDDQILPMILAERLANEMRSAGLKHEFVSFRGGHGIGPDVLDRLQGFLARLLDEPPVPPQQP